MPRGRKKKHNTEKPPKTKKPVKPATKSFKPKKDISKEIQDSFFNDEIPDDGPIEENLDLADPELVDDETVDPVASDEVEVSDSTEDKKEKIESDDSEQVIVTTTFSDDGDERQIVQTIRKNLPPKDSWADKESKFKGGQKIMPASLKKEQYASYECSVVISASTAYNTYAVKHSRCMNETIIKGNEWVIASDECKPYVNYWDLVSPIIKMKR
jgi:hypothetical protein